MGIKESMPGVYQFARTAYYTILKVRYKNLSDKNYPCALKKMYYHKTGLHLDLENPKRFTEKIQYRKLFDRNELYTKLSDKYEVKKWVANRVGEHYVIKTLGVWKQYSDIEFNDLPERFVLKTTNATGTNLIVKNKSEFDKVSAKKKIEKWTKQKFGLETGFELQYQTIDNKIIAEEYIESEDDNLFDYKVHCFHGEPMFIQLIGDRDYHKHTGKQIIIDFNWNELDWCFDDYPKYEIIPYKPNNLNELYNIAKELSSDFDYVRVDLYDVNNRIFFGEMTFTPGSGFYRPVKNWTVDTDLKLGEMW
jgi:hypothetical protein